MKLNDKVYQSLLNKIHNGYYKEGEKIPTEKSLMETFSVSRSPVRDALKRLQNEGYIKRTPKKGSVVLSNSRVNEHIDFKGGFSKYFGNNWDSIETETLEVSTVIDPEISNLLEQDDDDSLIRILRVRKFDRKPVFFLRTHYPKYLVKDLNKEDFYDVNNLRDWIQKQTKTVFQYSNETIVAMEADKIISNNLEINEGDAILKIERFTHDTNHNLVEYVEYYVNTKIWKYHIDYEY